MIVNKYQGNGGGGGYTLPVATATRLGGIKVGSGLTIDASGILSTSGGTSGDSHVLKFSQTFPANPEKGDVVAKRSIRTGWSVAVGASANALYWKFPQDSLQTPANVGKIAVESGYTFTIIRDSEGTSFTFAREDDASINAVITENSTEGTLDANGDGRTLQFNWKNGNEFGVRVMADAVGDIIPIELTEAPSLIAYTDGIWQFDGTEWVLQSVKDPATNMEYFDIGMFQDMPDSERSAWFDYFVGRAKAGDYAFGLYWLDRRYPDDYGRLTMDFARLPFSNVDGGFNGVCFAGTIAGGDNVRCLWARISWQGSFEFSKDTFVSSFNPSGFNITVDDTFAKTEGSIYMLYNSTGSGIAPGSYWSPAYFPIYHRYGQGDNDFEVGSILWSQRISSDPWITEHGGYGVIAEFIIPLSAVPYRVKVKALTNDGGEESWTVLSSTAF